MTAAGAGRRLIQQINEPLSPMQGVASAIDFNVKDRPISAATYQKLAQQNRQQAQVISDGVTDD